MLCEEKGARLRVASLDEQGRVVMEDFQKLLSPRTKLVAVAHVSNALGTKQAGHPSAVVMLRPIASVMNTATMIFGE